MGQQRTLALHKRIRSAPAPQKNGSGPCTIPVTFVKGGDRSIAVAPLGPLANGLGRPSACGQSRGSGRRDHHALKGKPEIGSGQEQEAESTIVIREAAHDDAGIIDGVPLRRLYAIKARSGRSRLK